jgi:hypothetical protein
LKNFKLEIEQELWHDMSLSAPEVCGCWDHHQDLDTCACLPLASAVRGAHDLHIYSHGSYL